MLVINNLQLRSARQVLNINIRDIALLLKISKSSVCNAELGKTRDFFVKHSPSLSDFFLKHKIIFPNQFSLRINDSLMNELSENQNFLTRFQLKAARALVNVSQRELACILDIDKNIISRAEIKENKEIIYNNICFNTTLKNFFFSKGIEFPDPFFIFFKKLMDKQANT